jgi:hypothetical protein
MHNLKTVIKQSSTASEQSEPEQKIIKKDYKAYRLYIKLSRAKTDSQKAIIMNNIEKHHGNIRKTS